jgi:hypothetical protein
LKPKDASKDRTEFAEVVSLVDQNILFALEENGIHQCSKPEDPSTVPILIGLDLPLTTLISIAGKRKKLITCT